MEPVCIAGYNNNRGAVDTIDMQISFSESFRKSIKKFFFHFWILQFSMDLYCQKWEKVTPCN
jgi:hypothetical protein